MKNDGTYFLVVQDAKGKLATYKPELVYPFDWEGIEVFAHRVYREECSIDDDKFWQVTVKSCGLSLDLKGIMTISDAKNEVIRILGSKGKEAISNVMDGKRKALDIILKEVKP